MIEAFLWQHQICLSHTLYGSNNWRAILNFGHLGNNRIEGERNVGHWLQIGHLIVIRTKHVSWRIFIVTFVKNFHYVDGHTTGSHTSYSYIILTMTISKVKIFWVRLFDVMLSIHVCRHRSMLLPANDTECEREYECECERDCECVYSMVSDVIILTC